MHRFIIPVLLLILLATGCSVNSFRTPVEPSHIPARIRSFKKIPEINIGLMTDVRSLTFTTDRSCTITSHAGGAETRISAVGIWEAAVSSSVPGKDVFILVAASMSSHERAEIKSAEFTALGFETFIYQLGNASKDGNGRNGNYRVCLKQRFPTREEAENYRDSTWNQLETFVSKLPVQVPGGKIILTESKSGKKYQSDEPVIITGDRITLHQVDVGTGFHWEHQEDRCYAGEIILKADGNGNLAVINRTNIEDYLMGVVPSEMPREFPLEALKAQAVAARSEVLAKLGRSHADDPFDVCADVHCQVYSGITNRSKSTDRAVMATVGQVLMAGGEIIDAVYSAVCGGHTENSDDVWGGEPLDYLKGTYDSRGRLPRSARLTKEKNARRFIDGNPVVYCNSTRGKIVEAMEYTKKYFRWSVTLKQGELRTNLERTTGKNVGPIVNLIPLIRGESGRIISLKIEGSRGSYVIGRELKIRKALSQTTLWSSCFYVQAGTSRNGAPEEFILKGAGFGHGVGMCQTGAAGMALKRKKYKEILSHYYKGTRIRRIY